MKRIFLAAAMLTNSFYAMACDIHGKTGFLPENDLSIGVEEKDSSNITKEQFNKIIDDVAKIYRKGVEETGRKLKVIKLWDSATVNAYAKRKEEVLSITMFGGLARHEVVTPDAFAMVVCHELGHHLGGSPRKSRRSSMWASNEGQSDYWAATKCMKRLFELNYDESFLETAEIPESTRAACEDAFTTEVEIGPSEDPAQVRRNIVNCQRTAIAGVSLSRLFAHLRGEDPMKYKIENPSEVVQATTIHHHPEGQCRLDTYVQGALCNKSPKAAVSGTDAEQGFCTISKGYDRGVRPACWYNPSDLNIQTTFDFGRSRI